MNKTSIFKLSALADRKPEYALVGQVDLVVVRFDEEVSVFYGRCLHRGALMSDGHVRGNDLICGVHNWDYRLDSGVSAYANDEKLPKFTSWIEGDDLMVDADEINAWGFANPQPYNRDAYLGLYADPSHGIAEEPYNGIIQNYAKNGLSKTGHHGVVDSMGVPRTELPDWDDIQRRVEDLPSFNAVTRRVQRLLIGHATDVQMDASGRVLLTPPLRTYANLDKRGVLIGQGKKMELWDESAWNNKRDIWVEEGQNLGIPEELAGLSL